MMAKEKSERKEKKEKKRSEADGVSKTSSKREKKDKKDPDLAKKLALHVNDAADQENAMSIDGIPVAMIDVDGVEKRPLLAALVPFANPLADEKQGKKVLKGVKKAAKNKTLKRGVKEVVKALRKSPVGEATSGSPIGVVVLAADISPMDVISHIPVLCEDHGIPYVYVPSRAELGAAGATKRPTSVVMVSGDKKPSKDDKKDDGGSVEDWRETYGDLVKVIIKAGKDVKENFT